MRDSWKELTPQAQHLIRMMLKVNPTKRYSIEECLSHPWVTRDLTMPLVDRSGASSGSRPVPSSQILPLNPENEEENGKRLLINAQDAAMRRAVFAANRHKRLVEMVERDRLMNAR
jgi:serine/threonine protein kinase